MNLLDKSIQDFINQNLNTSIADLLLKKSLNPDWDMRIIVEQIRAKNKAKSKLSTWFEKENIIYKSLSLEQCSSEITGKFKVKLIDGESLADLTGGFGVDTYFFSQKFKEVYHVEPNADLQDIVKNNFQELEIENVKFINEKAKEFLQKIDEVDCIYLDPSRRRADKKVFLLEDCEPQILEVLPQIFKKSKQVLIKLSPMLDIKQAIQSLSFVKQVLVLAVSNEVKELLFLLEKDFKNEAKITAVNIQKNKEESLSFTYSKEEKTEIHCSKPLKYLYEPYTSILKSGAFKVFAKQFNLSKLHPNSHLYTSDNLINCPARIFEIKAMTKYQKKAVLKFLPNKKANITARNFPESVQKIRQKLQLKDGGQNYIFATRAIDEKLIILIGEKIK